MVTSKKCLVLDLDNTLWGGVVGEDGPQGIQLDFEAPGSYFLAFQQAILDLYNRGIILAINSRNNYDDAMEIIRRHPNMVLKEHHFAAMRINWNDKVDNMRELANELNIGTDSMAFFDDDPVNRSLMRQMMPEVKTPELPQNPAQYAPFLLELPYFERSELTAEDKMRGRMYVTERLRKKAEETHASRESFLSSLGLKALCYQDDASSLARLAQLTEKTNQFNMNKQPLTEEEIRRYIDSPDHAVFHLAARDTFGDYGIVGFALVKKGPSIWRLESLLMSCRALGKGIEEAFMHFITEQAKKNGITELEIVFKETSKNQPAKDFLNRYFDGVICKVNTASFKLPWIEYKWKS